MSAAAMVRRDDFTSINDPPVAVATLIETTREDMVIRELGTNAMEAAMKLPVPGRIEFFVEEYDGVPKLGLFNEGPGMSADKLREYTNFFSGEKTRSPNDHYGIGGKAAALKVSPLGVIYRSCTGGEVHEIRLACTILPGYDYAVAHQCRLSDEDTVIIVTDDYRDRRDRDLSKEWTEVVLLGKSKEQNTTTTLIESMTGKRWIMELLNKRFYDMPEGIKFTNPNLDVGGDHQHVARGLIQTLRPKHSEAVGYIDKEEDVLVNHPQLGAATFRYILLKDGNNRGLFNYGIGEGHGICLAWKNSKGGLCTEIYEYRQRWGGAHLADKCGIHYGADRVAVHILLPENAPVRDSLDRVHLMRRGSNEEVHIGDFTALVKEYRPEWLVEYIDSKLKLSDDQDDVQKVLQDYMEQLNAQAIGTPRVKGEGDTEGRRDPAERNGSGRGGVRGENNGTRTKPRCGAATGRNLGAPIVDFTNDPTILESMGQGAAWCDENMTHVWLNPNWQLYVIERERFLASNNSMPETEQELKDIYSRHYRIHAGMWVVQLLHIIPIMKWNLNTVRQEVLKPLCFSVHFGAHGAYNEAMREARLRRLR